MPKKKEEYKCCKCKERIDEIWQFGQWDFFIKYWGKDYCETCFNKLFEKLWRKIK